MIGKARALFGFGVLVCLFSADGLPAWGAPITIVPDTASMFRDARGVNSIGAIAGDRVQYGADIQGGAASTSISAFNGNVIVPSAPCSPPTSNANLCTSAFAFNSTL